MGMGPRASGWWNRGGRGESRRRKSLRDGSRGHVSRRASRDVQVDVQRGVLRRCQSHGAALGKVYPSAEYGVFARFLRIQCLWIGKRIAFSIGVMRGLLRLFAV